MSTSIQTALMLLVYTTTAVSAEPFSFRAEEIDRGLGVGYAVRLLDMNGDERLDVVVVDQRRVIWFANPDWKQHTMINDQTKPDNVCFAPHDIDGDGDLDFALGADWRFTRETVGTLQWLRQDDKDALWTVIPIDTEPFIHRIRWADLDGDGSPELIVLPLLAAGTDNEQRRGKPVKLIAYRIPDDPVKGRWVREVLNSDLHVAHNFWPTDLNHDGKLDLLVVSFEGVSWLERSDSGRWKRTLIGKGYQEGDGSRGASEVKHGRFADGDYIATVEPWHGHQVVVYTRPEEGQTLWKRRVLDDQLKWGHAVWCTNLDDDPDQELVIGVRDNMSDQVKSGVRIYDPAGNKGNEWRRHLIDPGGVAVEDLAAADLDNDGDVDLVAVGRKTRNVKIYWNEHK